MICAVRVRGRERPTVSGVHRLEHVEGFAAADLAHDDPVRPHAQRGPQQSAHVDRAGTLDARRPCLERDDVRLRQPELGGVFDRHDALAFSEGVSERVEGRRLPTRRPARDQDGSSLTHRGDEKIHRHARAGPKADEVIRRQRSAREAPDGEHRAMERDRRDHGVHARAIG